MGADVRGRDWIGQMGDRGLGERGAAAGLDGEGTDLINRDERRERRERRGALVVVVVEGLWDDFRQGRRGVR